MDGHHPKIERIAETNAVRLNMYRNSPRPSCVRMCTCIDCSLFLYNKYYVTVWPMNSKQFV